MLKHTFIVLLLLLFSSPAMSYNQPIKKLRVLIDEYKINNSPAPYDMAHAVVTTKRPALYSSLSIEESNGDPNAIGDHGKSFGAFQIQPKHYGKVPKNIKEQTKKAELILEDLIEKNKGKLRISLAQYNGGNNPPKKSYRYADRILQRED